MTQRYTTALERLIRLAPEHISAASPLEHQPLPKKCAGTGPVAFRAAEEFPFTHANVARFVGRGESGQAARLYVYQRGATLTR